ncbi:hypothetical protein [Alteromonas sp. M12]|uniref:hypothetical protein n=1 Tax=Alteromonas sp. M12 TaxID=3135644 RepID=UPI00319DFBEE
MNEHDFSNWIGKTRKTNANLDTWPANALAAVLNMPELKPSADLPGLWHWLYFLERVPQSEIGADGHPVKGGFLPPVPHPRRMFAGGRTHYHQPLKLEVPATLEETVSNIQIKEGRQGKIYIVTVQFKYSQNSALCISEERDFVYLPEVAKPTSPTPLADEVNKVEEAKWSLDLPTDITTLFRFSALTFNSHRIHYDLEYAKKQEGYPQLVVHGPLTAILLSETVRRNSERQMRSFSFRAQSPLFCGQTIRTRGNLEDNDNVNLVAYTPAGEVAVNAKVSFA